MTPMKTLAASALALALAGCASMAPTYERPANPVGIDWPAATGAQSAGAAGDAAPATAGTHAGMADAAPAAATSAADLQWQALFADPQLRTVVQRALDNNRDLRVAALNVEHARAQHRIQRADSLPTVGASVAGDSQRAPDALSPGGEGGVARTYTAGIGISAFELDLWGRVRSLDEQALQDYLATAEARRATHIGLVSQVSATYLGLAADRDLELLAKQTLDSRGEAMRIRQARHAAGTASGLDLRQAEAELEDARTRWLEAGKRVETGRNALDLLVGARVEDALLPQPGTLDGMLAVRDIPAGLPSDLLRDRPDILAAEHALMGANANIGAARAAFFPRISLTGGFGSASDALSGLFEGGTRTWSFSPVISLPIFSGGRLKAQLDASEVRKDIGIAEYERAIQSAFREVADALAVRRVVDGQRTARQRQAAAAADAHALVTLQYDAGVTGNLEVLDAQRTLLAAREGEIAAELARQVNVVDLYRALGGGWSGEAGDAVALAPADAPR